jgi:hypothetical protein
MFFEVILSCVGIRYRTSFCVMVTIEEEDRTTWQAHRHADRRTDTGIQHTSNCFWTSARVRSAGTETLRPWIVLDTDQPFTHSRA